MDIYTNELRQLENEIDYYIMEIANIERDKLLYPIFRGWEELAIPLVNKKDEIKRLEICNYIIEMNSIAKEIIEYNDRLVNYITNLRKRYTYIVDLIEIDEAMSKAKKNGVIGDDFINVPIMVKDVVDDDDFGSNLFEWIH